MLQTLLPSTKIQNLEDLAYFIPIDNEQGGKENLLSVNQEDIAKAAQKILEQEILLDVATPTEDSFSNLKNNIDVTYKIFIFDFW